ncbi:protein NEGATIVE REGULATOR OF RESISTANCE-like [Cornus florida]|uniref:protein NEGATIVE REGULATOR OF RESISTANCE-like n=1 Tax=Cornus florida TaxID=4283 RepID=UPI00289C66FE|nr:protein NEGATIVE REGULATOR OF RESISTANCE-like [Cornus florida]
MGGVDKRKRTDDREMGGKRSKAREDHDGVKMAATQEDEEVDEFFAILRRIHVAVKYFEKRYAVPEGRRRVFTAWRPSFTWEDFEGVNGVNEPANREERPESRYLDLNSDPTKLVTHPKLKTVLK